LSPGPCEYAASVKRELFLVTSAQVRLLPSIKT
jgi:hypothetical protein